MSGKPAQIGGLFAATLLKTNNVEADLLTFDGTARYVNISTRDSVMTIAGNIPFTGGGTNFHAIFEKANKKYDRVIILSDMQGWMGGNAPTAPFAAYKKKYGANPKIYSFDLQGYGSLQFPEKNVYCLAGFSDKVFDIMGMCEVEGDSIVKRIEEVSFKSE